MSYYVVDPPLALTSALGLVVGAAKRGKEQKAREDAYLASLGEPTGCGCTATKWCLDALKLRQASLLAPKGEGEAPERRAYLDHRYRERTRVV